MFWIAGTWTWARNQHLASFRSHSNLRIMMVFKYQIYVSSWTSLLVPSYTGKWLQISLVSIRRCYCFYYEDVLTQGDLCFPLISGLHVSELTSLWKWSKHYNFWSPKKRERRGIERERWSGTERGSWRSNSQIFVPKYSHLKSHIPLLFLIRALVLL